MWCARPNGVAGRCVGKPTPLRPDRTPAARPAMDRSVSAVSRSIVTTSPPPPAPLARGAGGGLSGCWLVGPTGFPRSGGGGRSPSWSSLVAGVQDGAGGCGDPVEPFTLTRIRVRGHRPAVPVHDAVMTSAQQRKVRHLRRPAVAVTADVVGVAPVHWCVTTREHAPSVSVLEVPALQTRRVTFTGLTGDRMTARTPDRPGDLSITAQQLPLLRRVPEPGAVDETGPCRPVERAVCVRTGQQDTICEQVSGLVCGGIDDDRERSRGALPTRVAVRST